VTIGLLSPREDLLLSSFLLRSNVPTLPEFGPASLLSPPTQHRLAFASLLGRPFSYSSYRVAVSPFFFFFVSFSLGFDHIEAGWSPIPTPQGSQFPAPKSLRSDVPNFCSFFSITPLRWDGACGSEEPHGDVPISFHAPRSFFSRRFFFLVFFFLLVVERRDPARNVLREAVSVSVY